MLEKLSLGLLCLVLTSSLYASTLTDGVYAVQKQWAEIKYRLNDDQKSDAYEALIKESEALITQFPDKAEPLIWSAIVYSSYAGAVGGIKSVTKALPAVKKARDLLLESERIDASALNGSALTSLGALYYQVPGWPLGFGDKKTAREYLEKAVQTDPDGLDSNFFYGDFLFERKEYVKAITVLEHALAAPELAQRPVADEGRRKEIRETIKAARARLS